MFSKHPVGLDFFPRNVSVLSALAVKLILYCRARGRKTMNILGKKDDFP